MRVKGGTITRKRHKKVLKLAKGYRGRRSKIFKIANQSVIKAMYDSYVDRKRKKREFRKLWIIRINAALRNLGFSYSRFMGLLKKENINLNRKILADLCVSEPKVFEELVNQVK
ncbi:MAG TPA: 50S ribosomal protein L20 [Dictyoglomaceae bacterium]|nr:50S ribosomal protein L20 [Dictyoglomaceae bacterium]HOL38909.1 50S ribosomal protein L20 [Dictyoglomaceae bacterium]HPP15674.1 50S ribosomal protein L20 [Dictyoglomaceae bacterium]